MNRNKEILLDPTEMVPSGKGKQEKLALLEQLERKVLWLSAWMIALVGDARLN